MSETVNHNQRWVDWNEHADNCIQCRTALAVAAAENKKQQGQRIRGEAITDIKDSLCEAGKPLFPTT